MGYGITPGLFWLPGRDERRVEGSVDWDRDRPVLDADDWLTPPYRRISPDEIPKDLNFGLDALVSADDPVEPEQITVHGQLNGLGGSMVTLVDTMVNRRNAVVGGGLGLRHTERRTASYALRGGLVDGPEQPFRAARIGYQNLDNWTNFPGATGVPEQPGTFSTELERPSGQLSVERGVPGTWSLASGRTEIRWSTDDGVGLTFDELWTQLVNPLRTLLTIAIDAPIFPTSLHLQLSPGAEWLEVVHPELSDSEDLLPWSRTFLNHNHLTLNHFANWLRDFRKLSPVPGLVAAAIVGGTQSIEFQVLELAAAAEGLDRRIGDPERSMTKARARWIRRKAKESLSDDIEALKVIDKALQFLGEPSYADRIQELIEMSSGVVPEITGIADRWISRVTAARHGFAHLLNEPGTPSRTDYLGYYVIKQSLRWLVGIVLLLQVGVKADDLRSQLIQHQGYQFLLRQASRWMADVYQPEDGSS